MLEQQTKQAEEKIKADREALLAKNQRAVEQWKPEMEKYQDCNDAAARGIAAQQGDPVSLALAARGLCAQAEARLRQAMHDAYADIDPDIGMQGIEMARKKMLERNAAHIVAVRAARESAPPPPKPPQARDY